MGAEVSQTGRTVPRLARRLRVNDQRGCNDKEKDFRCAETPVTGLARGRMTHSWVKLFHDKPRSLC
jgi:hypothetical protein